MQATDFDLSRDMEYDPERGITRFRQNRMVILNAEALGLLRHNLIESFGYEAARELFLEFGYQSGHADLLQMKMAYDFDGEEELLAAGPVVHSYEGIVNAEPTELEFDRDAGHFHFRGVWHNSYEAEQHLIYQQESESPTCWTLMGYASGWCTAFFGSPVIAIEQQCAGTGDAHCEWLVKPPSEWGSRAEPYVDALENYVG